MNKKNLKIKDKKTFYNLNQLIENDKGWLFYDAALKNWKSMYKRFLGNNILDLGCGSGISIGINKVFDPQKNFVGFEGDKKLNKVWELRNVNVVTGDIYKLPFKNNQFDTVYSSHVLEHLKYPTKAIIESIRVAKKRIIHSVPAGNVNDKNFGSPHLHIFNRKNFIELFNFKNIEIREFYFLEDVHMSSLIVILDKK